MHMKRRTVIITGANSGIGKAAARKFAEEGHTVIMACRNLKKSLPARDEVVKVSAGGRVVLEELDMSSFNSIRSFCATMKNDYKQLDTLIHNAAYFNHGEGYRLSPDGIELTFATNLFGPFLMTRLLKDMLAASDDPGILHAGSNIIKHFFNPAVEIPFDNLQGEYRQTRPHSVYVNYRNSKMALLMLTFRMAEKFNKDGIRVNSLQINGARMSKETLGKFKPKWRFIARVQNLFFRSPEFIANRYYEICTSDKFRDVTGKQFNHRLEIMQPALENRGFLTDVKQAVGASVYPAYAHRKDVADHLWELCEEWTSAGQKRGLKTESESGMDKKPGTNPESGQTG